MVTFQRIGILVLVVAASFSAGRFLAPPKVETKEVEKIVYRANTDTTRQIDKTETVKPDGTRIITTSSTTKRITETAVDKESEKTVVATARPDWHLTVRYEPLIAAYQGEAYSIDIQRRILGEVYLGASVSNQSTVGISIGVGF